MGLKNWLIQKGLEGKYPLWVYRLIGKKLKKIIKFEEDNMADPVVKPSKPWYQSKGVWTAIVSGILGLVQPISTAFGHPYQIPLWVFEVLAGLGLYTLRSATTTIEK